MSQQVTYTKQHKLHKEIGETFLELEKVGIIKPTDSPFNTSVWPVKESNGFWLMTVNYRELKKVIPPLHAAVPSIAGLMDTLSHELGHIIMW